MAVEGETAKTERRSSNWERDGAYTAIYAVLSLLYFLPALLPGAHIFGTDYLAAGYFKHEFASGLIADGVLPSWIPHIYGGVPFFANPASTFYPVKLLVDLVFPVTMLYPAMFVVHFALAGIGAYLLARELGVRPWIAFVTGLAFQFTGLMMSFVYGGHDGRIIVATLTPLLFFFLHRGIRLGTLPSFAGAAATIGLGLLTFQIQSNYYLLLAAAIWAVFVLVHLGYARRPGPLSKRLVLGLGAVAFGFSLAAVNFLPFLDYVDASPRGGEEGRGYEYSTSWSMSPREVTGLAVPEDVGVSVSDPRTGDPQFPSYRGENPFKLHTEYAGALVLLLFAFGLYFSRQNRYWWFFLGLMAFTFTLAFGGHTPLYRLYYEVLPGTNRFRAPSIAFFLVPFSLAVMAALTLERLAVLRESHGRKSDGKTGGDGLAPAHFAGWGAAAIGTAGVILAGIMTSGADDTARAAGVLRFTFFAVLMAVTLWAWLKGRLGRRATLALLAVLTVTDLWVVDRRFFATVPPPAEMFARDDVATFLVSQPGRDRVWTLPFPAGSVYRDHGNYLMLFGIDQAGGEHGNQLQRYNEYVGAGEETYVDWHNFLQHPAFLNAANVRYIIAGQPLQGVGLPEVHRGSAVVYENPDALPRAYLVHEVVVADEPDGALELMARPGFDPRTTAVVYPGSDAALPGDGGASAGTTEIAVYESDRVVVRTAADERGLLVLADNMYEGWEATIDGEPAPILYTNHTFRGVVVEAGEHEVIFRFRPPDLRLGFWIYVVGLSLLLAYGAFLAVRMARTESVGRANAD